MAKTIDELARDMAKAMQKNSYTGRDFNEVKSLAVAFISTIQTVLLYSDLDLSRVQRATIELNEKGFNQSRVLGEIVRLVGAYFKKDDSVFDVLGEVVATYNEYAVQHTRKAVEELVMSMSESSEPDLYKNNPYTQYLNDKHKEALFWLSDGLSNPQIAEKMNTTSTRASVLISESKRILRIEGLRENIERWARMNMGDYKISKDS